MAQVTRGAWAVSGLVSELAHLGRLAAIAEEIYEQYQRGELPETPALVELHEWMTTHNPTYFDPDLPF